MSVSYKFGHLAVEEGQEQGADVGSIDIGIGHNDNLMIAQLIDIEIITDISSQGGDHRLNNIVIEHLIQTGFFYI